MKGSKRVVFVIDASGSMLNKLDAVKHEFEAAVDGLDPAASFNIITISDQATPMSPKWVAAGVAGKRAARHCAGIASRSVCNENHESRADLHRRAL